MNFYLLQLTDNLIMFVSPLLRPGTEMSCLGTRATTANTIAVSGKTQGQQPTLARIRHGGGDKKAKMTAKEEVAKMITGSN